MSWAHVPLPRSPIPPTVPPRFEQQNPGPHKYLNRDTDIDVISIPAIGADPKFTWARWNEEPDAHSKPGRDSVERRDWADNVSQTSELSDSSPTTQGPNASVSPTTAAAAAAPPDTGRRFTIFHPSSRSPRVNFDTVDPFRSNTSQTAPAEDERRRSISLSPPRFSQTRRFSSVPPNEVKIKPKAEPAIEWLGQPLRADVPRARIAHYRHPVHQEYLLEDYGRSLLRFLLDDRSQFALQRGSEKRSTLRPTLFVCHSTGGLVLKKALVLAKSLSEEIGECGQLVRDAVGFCFFAVPHSGSAVLSDPLYKDSITSLLRLRYDDPSDRRSEKYINLPMSEGLANELSPTNEELTALTAQFAPIARRANRIWTFIEAKDVKLEILDITDQGYQMVKRARRVVTRPSATLGTSVYPMLNETLEEISNDHAKLCSFPAESGLYARNFRIALQHFLANVVQAQLAREDIVVKHVPLFIHQFQRIEKSLIVSSVTPTPTLHDFLEKGPSTLIQGSRKRFERSHGLIHLPAVHIRPPSPDVDSTHSDAGKQVLVQSSLLQVQVDGRNDEMNTRPAPHMMFEESSNVFNWTHVPYTCPRWVPDVLNRIMREKSDEDVKTTILTNELWAKKQHRARHNSPHARFLKPTFHMISQSESRMTLYLPYLHWDTFRHFQGRTKAIKERLQCGDVPPADHVIQGEKSLEKKLIQQYLIGKDPLHCRRTLDQFGFPMLRNTSDRDMDQILFKRTRPEVVKDDRRQEIDYSFDVSAHQVKLQKEDGDRKMLMVDTMWLFVLDKENVVSFFPRRERDEGKTGDLHLESDLHQAIYDEVNLDDLPDYTAMDFAALAVRQAVRALLGEEGTPKVDPTLEVFRIFEEYINYLTENQTASFKAFRDRIEVTFRNITTMKQWAAAGPDNNDEHDFSSLLEFRDIMDELGTIGKLFDVQMQVIIEMKHHYSPSSYGAQILEDVTSTLEGYMAQHREMVDRATAGQQSATSLLDMKQKQANVDEAMQARIQAQEAAGQSRIILVFTIFTVIFLPLSFFTSLFGMNVREWSGQSSNPTSHTVIVYMLTISFGIIALAFLLAFVKSVRIIATRLPAMISSLGLAFLVKVRIWGFMIGVYSKLRKLVQRIWLLAVGSLGRHSSSGHDDVEKTPPSRRRRQQQQSGRASFREILGSLTRKSDGDVEAGPAPLDGGVDSRWNEVLWEKRRQAREAFEGGKGRFEK